MKPICLDRRLDVLSEKMGTVPFDIVRVDSDSFPENERQLIAKVSALELDDFSSNLPREVVEENNRLMSKFFEVFARRIIDLFLEAVPTTLCCDEIERWYFKLHFYNFLADFTECHKRVRGWSSKDREDFLKMLKDSGGIDGFFRLPRINLELNETVEAKSDKNEVKTVGE